MVITNITTRINFSAFNWINNPLFYYDYVFDDIDTIDGIADRYYNDSSLHWVILVTNGIINPVFDLPLREEEFNNYLNQKYHSYGAIKNISGIDYAMSTLDPVYGYRKLVQVVSVNTNETINSDYFILDEISYNSVIEYNTYFMNNGEKYNYSISKLPPLSIYDHEYAENEKKRNIKILKKDYINEAKTLFNNLTANLDGN